jgi:hypothetical protein
MINILDKKTLENRFADNFGSPFFPILADMYLVEGDLPRARKVCEVGLGHDSTNTDGKFVLSRVDLAEDKFAAAEKLLKQVVGENQSHFNALRMLIKLEFKLKRSPKTIQKYINRLLHFLPNDAECIKWMDEMKVEDGVPAKQNEGDLIAMSEKTIPGVVKINKAPAPVKNQAYNVDTSMATFTMVQVLKSQKHYGQALSVLGALESAGQDKNKIDQEKEVILQCISESKQ